MIFKKSIIDQCIDLNLKGVVIEKVRKIKHLGIIVDHKMQWKEHFFMFPVRVKKFLMLCLEFQIIPLGLELIFYS